VSAPKRVWRAFDAIVLGRLRRWRDELVEHVPKLAHPLYRGADAAANLPFRAEAIDLPRPLELGSLTLDVVEDLAAYTGLQREVVESELLTRSGISFRAEWHSTPTHLREDNWFYLSSKTYLFANAIHFPDTSFQDRFIRPHLAPGAPVLDFGAGTGNLALMLAADGTEVWVSELNALQRDFIRFRLARHGVQDMVTVIDPWADVPSERFGTVVAVDVLEHLPDCRSVLERRLLPSLTPDGVLVENSPFVVNSANPMHYADFGLERFLNDAGFGIVANDADGTRAWRREQ